MEQDPDQDLVQGADLTGGQDQKAEARVTQREATLDLRLPDIRNIWFPCFICLVDVYGFIFKVILSFGKNHVHFSRY